LVGLAGDRIPRVEVNDRSACFGRTDRSLSDFFRSDRQVGGHRWGMDRPCDGACDDDFAGHGVVLSGKD
jgi:hypothetical protein